MVVPARPHRLQPLGPTKYIDLQFIVSTFQAGGRSLFIIHWLILTQFEVQRSHVDARFCQDCNIARNLGWFTEILFVLERIKCSGHSFIEDLYAMYM